MYLFIVLEAESPRSKCEQIWVWVLCVCVCVCVCESSLSWLADRCLSLCPPMDFSPCLCIPGISSSCKGHQSYWMRAQPSRSCLTLVISLKGLFLIGVTLGQKLQPMHLMVRKHNSFNSNQPNNGLKSLHNKIFNSNETKLHQSAVTSNLSGLQKKFISASHYIPGYSLFCSSTFALCQ